MSNCCQTKSCEVESLVKNQTKTLWIVLVINAIMFGAEAIAGLIAGSVVLMADSLDMLGDTLVYGFSLYVVGRSVRWRAGAALLKGIIMVAFGLGVIGQAIYKVVSGTIPDASIIGVMGAIALCANAVCLVLLTRHKADDINMHSTWICSRNDIVANLGVLAAAAGVFITGSMWPDLLISLLITAVFLQSAASVLGNAYNEIGGIDAMMTHLKTRKKTCRDGICPPGTCFC